MCYFMQSKYNLDEIWFQISNYKNNWQGQMQEAIFISITQAFSRLLAFYSESLSTTYRVANAVFALTRWAALLHLPLIPGAFSPCLYTSCRRSLLFLSCLQSESVLIVRDFLYCCEGHIHLILGLWRSLFHLCAFLRVCQHVDVQHTAQSRPAPLMPSHFHHVPLRVPEPFSQMRQQCASCPSIRGVVVFLQSTQHATIHKQEVTFSSEHRYNICVWHNPAQSAHTLAVYDWNLYFLLRRWWGNNLGVFKLGYIRSHFWYIFLIVQAKLVQNAVLTFCAITNGCLTILPKLILAPTSHWNMTIALSICSKIQQWQALHARPPVALSQTLGIDTLKQVDTLTTSMSRPFIRSISTSAYKRPYRAPGPIGNKRKSMRTRQSQERCLHLTRQSQVRFPYLSNFSSSLPAFLSRFWLWRGVSSGSCWILRGEQRWCQRPWASSGIWVQSSENMIRESVLVTKLGEGTSDLREVYFGSWGPPKFWVPEKNPDVENTNWKIGCKGEENLGTPKKIRSKTKPPIWQFVKTPRSTHLIGSQWREGPKNWGGDAQKIWTLEKKKIRVTITNLAIYQNTSFSPFNRLPIDRGDRKLPRRCSGKRDTGPQNSDFGVQNPNLDNLHLNAVTLSI